MNEALKLASKYWDVGKLHYRTYIQEKDDAEKWAMECSITHSPYFWQALGKALNLNTRAKEVSDGSLRLLMIGWENFALHYFHLLLEGSDIEKFWKELLTPHAE